jgi:hypothetical protein
MEEEKNSKIEIQETPTQQTQTEPQTKEIRLVDIEVKDENTALNLLVSFVNVAHKKGVYSLDESAKIWECIKMFQKPSPI